jgi:hypothetical protein
METLLADESSSSTLISLKMGNRIIIGISQSGRIRTSNTRQDFEPFSFF